MEHVYKDSLYFNLSKSIIAETGMAVIIKIHWSWYLSEGLEFCPLLNSAIVDFKGDNLASGS